MVDQLTYRWVIINQRINQFLVTLSTPASTFGIHKEAWSHILDLAFLYVSKESANNAISYLDDKNLEAIPFKEAMIIEIMES